MCACSQKTDCLVVLRIAYAVENVPQYCGREIHVYVVQQIHTDCPGVYSASVLYCNMLFWFDDCKRARALSTLTMLEYYGIGVLLGLFGLEVA